jgi:hypothetical protein
VAAEAARRVQVTAVVGVRPPVGLHFGKDGALVDLLQCRDARLHVLGAFLQHFGFFSP